MNSAVEQMLAKYSLNTRKDHENALKEIVQEIALLGLQRANFFEKAAFYGGTALRILHGLPRFSEDLDFTLHKPDEKFKLRPYFSAVERELTAYGFEVEISEIKKSKKTEIESAFIKANTETHLLKIQSLQQFSSRPHANESLQIKFEVDTDPAPAFQRETKYLLLPVTFPVLALKKPDLFAGKIHALLFRNWKHRIKGRDFYDFIWFLATNTPVQLEYLRAKALQSGHLGPKDLKSAEDLRKLLRERFKAVDFAKAKNDVLPFIKDPRELDAWSLKFFTSLTKTLEIC